MIRSGWAFVAGILAALAAWAWWVSPSEAATRKGESFDVSGREDVPDEAPPEAGTDWKFWTYWGNTISDEVKRRVDDRIVTLAPTIERAATHFDVPPDLLAAVLHRESRGDLTAVGDGGASVGAGQVSKGAQDTVNRYWGTDLRRSNWVHNIFLSAGYLRYLYEEIYTSWTLGLARPTHLWFHSTRGYLCGRKGAEENGNCAAEEARKRLTIAGMQNQIPKS